MNHPPLSAKPNILVAPLDWGLGHATRCIPLVRELIDQDCQPVLAASGRGKSLLEAEFPQLTTISLPGYDVRYSRSPVALPLVIARQIPKILSAIRKENQQLRAIVHDHHIRAVISDNRYGLYHPSVPSIFLTHQLLIKTPFGAAADRYLQKLNYSYINQFTECWVPDDAHGDNLAGELSHPLIEPALPLKYIGALSRFKPGTQHHDAKHLLVLLSGPEPQRTMLEQRLLQQLKTYGKKTIFVRGLPGSTQLPAAPPHVILYNHLPAHELRLCILEAGHVVARCGYSTVMDLAVLGKRAILIPTPGQTEQTYLARHLMKNNLALCIDQPRFRLQPALDLSATFPYRPFSVTTQGHLASAVKSLRYKIEFGNFSR